MTHKITLFACFFSLCAGSAAAQSPDARAAATVSGSPVAYVYVSRPTHIDGFAAAADGRLTPVPGSPFANIAVDQLEVTKKFLLGAGEDQQDIYSFSLAANGSIKPLGYTFTHVDDPDFDDACEGEAPILLDNTGSSLYIVQDNCDGDSDYVQSFKIDSNGLLTFLGNFQTSDEEVQGRFSTPVFLGNNQYAYETTCFNDAFEVDAEKRESNGALDGAGVTVESPTPDNSSDLFCPWNAFAADPSNHLALSGNITSGAPQLASFTADSQGNLTTTSTYKNMPSTEVKFPNVLSIDPTGKLLAVGGGGEPSDPSNGFQIFHFNGGNTITHYTGLLQSNVAFTQFAWDKANHLYALGGGQLRVYTVTPTSLKEAPGSPISIPASSSVAVLPLN